MDDEETVTEFRFKAVSKGLAMITSKLYDLECRIATLENREEAVTRVKIDLNIKNQGNHKITQSTL